MIPSRQSGCLLAASLLVSACAGSEPVNPENPGSGGAGAMAGAGGVSGAGGAPDVGGAAGAAGTTGAGGMTSAGGSAGAGGATSAGGAAGSGGATSAAGAAGAGGTTDAGNDAKPVVDGGGPKKQYACPAGPFPAQQLGASTTICTGLQYNYGYNEGPTWIASQNAFFFSNFVQGNSGTNKSAGDIIKYTPGGACEIWLRDVGCNGLGVSATGQLLAACHGPRAVMEYDVVTKQGRIVASTADGKQLDSPNDLVSHSNGTIYFSNTTYELGGRPAGGNGFALIRIDPAGTTSIVEKGQLNGVALSPDEKKLYVVQMGVWNLDDNGVPTTKTAEAAPTGDGIAVDCAGRVTANGTNSAYGGADGKTLFIVGPGTSARTVPAIVPGLP